MPICANANCNEFKGALDFYDRDIFGVCPCGKGYCKDCMYIFADKYGYLDYINDANQNIILCCDKCVTQNELEYIKNKSNKNLNDLTKLFSQLKINEPNK